MSSVEREIARGLDADRHSSQKHPAQTSHDHTASFASLSHKTQCSTSSWTRCFPFSAGIDTSISGRFSLAQFFSLVQILVQTLEFIYLIGKHTAEKSYKYTDIRSIIVGQRAVHPIR
jgi:hypothetical protein